MSRDLLLGAVAGAVVTLALLGLTAWLFVRRVRRQVESGLQPARVQPLRGWDYRMRLRTLDGETVDASMFRGRTLFLNFWATWCAPCVAELPSIERLMKRVGAADVVFAGVTSEPLEKVKAFVARRAPGLPIYVLLDEAPPMFETRSIPATFIVRDGEVISQHLGAARWDTDEVVALLSSSAPGPSAKLRAKWERCLPAIEPPWTHWRLLGVGDHGETSIADCPADDVTGAVRAVVANHRSFRTIEAELVRFADDGAAVRSRRRGTISSPEDRDP